MKKRLSGISIVALLLATAGVSGMAADAPVSIIVMFKSDVGQDEPGVMNPAELGRLQAETGFEFKWMGDTRTNARILRTPGALTQDEATALARRIGVMDGVLWADVDAGEGAVSARSAVPAVAVIEEFIIKFRRGAGSLPLDVEKLSAAAGVGLVPVSETVGAGRVYRLTHPVGAADADEIERRLEALPEVRYADPVTRMKAQAAAEPVTPNDEYFPQQWHLQSGPGMAAGSANVQAAWPLTRGAPEITVAVLDSGVLFAPTHPDLESRLEYRNAEKTAIVGWDMIRNLRLARDGNARDRKPKDEGDWEAVGWCGKEDGKPVPSEFKAAEWHGSHVAGIIGAATDNGIGVSGIDWFAKIEPVRVLGPCDGNNKDIIQGIWWAAGQKGIAGTRPNPRPANVLNMSLGPDAPGSGPCPDAMQEAIDYALSRNAAVVVSAGNESDNIRNYAPANCRGVIAVSAVGPSGDLASYSNFGAEVALAAPGGDTGAHGERPQDGILSTINTSQKRPSAEGMSYGAMDGTSMAAPVVSGVISLMLAADTEKKLNPQRIGAILRDTARPFPEGSRCATDLKGQCGAGIVDAYAAVKATMPAPPVCRIEPNARCNGADLSGRNLAKANLTGAELERANLDGANLTEALLASARMNQASLKAANLTGANLDFALATGANLDGAILTGAHLYNAFLGGASLANAKMAQANLWEAALRNADLRDADLSGAQLRSANLTGADLSRAKMNAATLHSADLSEAKLGAADLSGAKLGDAKASKAKLSQAVLNEASMHHIDLSGAELTDASLINASLLQANLTDANLLGANLTGARLTGVIFCRTRMPDGTVNNSNCPVK
ncbi:MAG: S8 family serine peptidase [Pseudomonadota bacterium]